jgi:hypothetical protein
VIHDRKIYTSSKGNIVVFDTMGKQQFKALNTDNAEVNIPSGLYIVRFESIDGSGIQSRKLIVK